MSCFFSFQKAFLLHFPNQNIKGMQWKVPANGYDPKQCWGVKGPALISFCERIAVFWSMNDNTRLADCQLQFQDLHSVQDSMLQGRVKLALIVTNPHYVNPNQAY